MTNMFLHAPGEEQNIVYVHEHKLIVEIPEYVFHQGLEHGWGVGESEGHDYILKMLGC